jgi:hypothetical protein
VSSTGRCPAEVADNRLEQDFNAEAPNRGPISFVSPTPDWLYLAVVLRYSPTGCSVGMCSRSIASWGIVNLWPSFAMLLPCLLCATRRDGRDFPSPSLLARLQRCTPVFEHPEHSTLVYLGRKLCLIFSRLHFSDVEASQNPARFNTYPDSTRTSGL